MECRKRLSPGMAGTKRHLKRFGDRLLFVRYRNDPERQRRLVTVELIVEEGPLLTQNPAIKHLFPHPNRNVLVRIDYEETSLREKAKMEGARWQAEEKRWLMRYQNAKKLGLLDRIEEVGDTNNGN